MIKNLSLDTMRIRFDLGAIESVDNGNFTKTANRRGEIKREWTRKAKKLGLSDIQLVENTYGLITFSAKILHENYFRGINIDTMENCLHNLNNYNLIRLNIGRFIQSGKVLKCDVVNDIEVEKPPDRYLNALKTLAINTKYNMTSYNGGICLMSKAKTVKERLSIYNKEKEIRKDRMLCDAYKTLLLQSHHKLRVEGNLKNKKDIKRGLGIEDNSLLSVLKSKNHYNYKLFKKIKMDIGGNLLADLEDCNNLNKFIKQKGMEAILRDCNGSLEAVKAITGYFGRNQYQDKQFKEVYKKMKAKEQKPVSQLLQEFEMKLQNALN